MRTRTVGLLLVLVLGFTGQAFGDEVVDGRLGPGALYRLVRPTNWNGSLLLYSHGAVPSAAPVALPAEANLFVALLAPRGFALAFSSYSENGWAVKDGVQRTHQLLEVFTERFGSPSRVYMGGASMGGLIAIELIEKHPGVFSGALAACAASGGSRAQFDYQANVRALFDVFYPGVLPGDAGYVPPVGDVTTAIVLPAAAAIQANPAGALTIASIAQTPIPFSNAAQLIESVTTALAGHALSFTDLVPSLPVGRYFDNQDVVYASAVLPPVTLALINAGVGRFNAAPSALNYLEHHYQPSGELRMPMLMLSTSLDPVVPGFHQTAYRDLVAAAGQSDLLVQRTVNRYGHCNFTPDEITAAFLGLVTWVELGIKPAP